MPIRQCPKGHITGSKRCPHCAPVLHSPIKRLARRLMRLVQGTIALGPTTERVVIAGMEAGSTSNLDLAAKSFTVEWIAGRRNNVPCEQRPDLDVRRRTRQRKHALHQFLARNDTKARAAHA